MSSGSTFYDRLIGVGDREKYERIPFGPFMGMVVLYRRGVRTDAELKAQFGISDPEWVDVMTMFSKVLAKGQSNKFLHDGYTVLSLAEWCTDEERTTLSLDTWSGFLATIDSMAASGHYD